jgi:hypothetical protein
MYHHELEAELSDAAVITKLGRQMKGMEEAVQKVATNTIGYIKKQARKEWFDKEWEKMNEGNDACRAINIQRRTRTANNK